MVQLRTNFTAFDVKAKQKNNTASVQTNKTLIARNPQDGQIMSAKPIEENPIQLALSRGKFHADNVGNLYNAATKGKGSDYTLGIANDTNIRMGSLGIATLSSSLSPSKLGSLGEFLGFATWFATMTNNDKITNSMVKAKYGLDLDMEYVDSYGRRKKVFEDPGFICWDMIPQEKLNKIGDRLGVPKGINNRNEAIQDKILQVVIQSKTWAMVSAGVTTPVVASLLADTLTPQVKNGFSAFGKASLNGLEPSIERYTNQAMEAYKRGDTQKATEIMQKASKKIESVAKRVFGETDNSLLTLQQWDKGNRAIVAKSGLMKDLEAVLQQPNALQNIANNLVPGEFSLIEATKDSVKAALDGIGKKSVTVGELPEVLSKITDSSDDFANVVDGLFTKLKAGIKPTSVHEKQLAKVLMELNGGKPPIKEELTQLLSKEVPVEKLSSMLQGSGRRISNSFVQNAPDLTFAPKNWVFRTTKDRSTQISSQFKANTLNAYAQSGKESAQKALAALGQQSEQLLSWNDEIAKSIGKIEQFQAQYLNQKTVNDILVDMSKGISEAEKKPFNHALGSAEIKTRFQKLTQMATERFEQLRNNGLGSRTFNDIIRETAEQHPNLNPFNPQYESGLGGAISKLQEGMIPTAQAQYQKELGALGAAKELVTSRTLNREASTAAMRNFFQTADNMNAINEMAKQVQQLSHTDPNAATAFFKNANGVIEKVLGKGVENIDEMLKAPDGFRVVADKLDDIVRNHAGGEFSSQVYRFYDDLLRAGETATKLAGNKEIAQQVGTLSKDKALGEGLAKFLQKLEAVSTPSVAANATEAVNHSKQMLQHLDTAVAEAGFQSVGELADKVRRSVNPIQYVDDCMQQANHINGKLKDVLMGLVKACEDDKSFHYGINYYKKINSPKVNEFLQTIIKTLPENFITDEKEVAAVKEFLKNTLKENSPEAIEAFLKNKSGVELTTLQNSIDEIARTVKQGHGNIGKELLSLKEVVGQLTSTTSELASKNVDDVVKQTNLAGFSNSFGNLINALKTNNLAQISQQAETYNVAKKAASMSGQAQNLANSVPLDDGIKGLLGMLDDLAGRAGSLKTIQSGPESLVGLIDEIDDVAKSKQVVEFLKGLNPAKLATEEGLKTAAKQFNTIAAIPEEKATKLLQGLLTGIADDTTRCAANFKNLGLAGGPIPERLSRHLQKFFGREFAQQNIERFREGYRASAAHISKGVDQADKVLNSLLGQSPLGFIDETMKNVKLHDRWLKRIGGIGIGVLAATALYVAFFVGKENKYNPDLTKYE